MKFPMRIDNVPCRAVDAFDSRQRNQQQKGMAAHEEDRSSQVNEADERRQLGHCFTVKGNWSSAMWPSTERTRNLTLYRPAGRALIVAVRRLGSSLVISIAPSSTGLPLESVTVSVESR